MHANVESLDSSLAAAAAYPARSCFAWQRREGAVVSFRFVVGLAVCSFFVRQQVESAPLLESGLLALPGVAASSPIAAIAPSALFGAGALLAAAIALGAWPHACAALLLPIAICVQRTLAPVARLDDWLSVVAVFWLLLLPRTAPRSSSGSRAVLHGAAINVLIAHALLLCLWPSGLRALSPAWPVGAPASLPLWLAAVPALYLLPIGPLRWLGPPLQLALHGYLAVHSGEWLAHALLAASGIFAIGELPRAGVERSARIDAPLIVAAGCSALLALAVLGGSLGWSHGAQRARRALAGFGLAPTRAAVGLPDATVAFRELDGRVRPWRELPLLPSASALRTQLVWSHWIAASAGSAVDRSSAERALSALSSHYCQHEAEQLGMVTLVLDDHRRAEPLALARFDCSALHHDARFVPKGD